MQNRPGYLLATCALGLSLFGCQTNYSFQSYDFPDVNDALPQEVVSKIGTEIHDYAIQLSGGEYVQASSLTEYANQVAQKIALTSDHPSAKHQVVILNRSDVQAYSLPDGTVLLTRGLVATLNNGAELAALIAHEIAHQHLDHLSNDADRQMTLALLLQIMKEYPQRNYPSSLVEVTKTLLDQQYQDDELFAADRLAMQYLTRAEYQPEALLNTIRLFMNLSVKDDNFDPYLHTHPMTQARVRMAERTLWELPQTLSWDFDEFQQAAAPLLDQLPAYEAQEQAIQALEDDKLDVAKQAIKKALRLHPNEADFYATKGDIYFTAQAYQKAINHYDIAIARQPFHKYYLHRAQAELQLKSFESADSDLQASASLLPTQDAFDQMVLIPGYGDTPQWLTASVLENDIKEDSDNSLLKGKTPE